MKKLSLKQRVRFSKKARRGNRPKRFVSKAAIAKRKYEGLNLPPKAKLQYTHRGATLVAPKNFNLSHDAEEVLSFLKVLRRVCSTNVRLYVDFTTIKTMSPMCALLLTSEIDRWRKYGERKLRVVDRDSWSPDIKRLLHQMGFNELIKPTDTFVLEPESSHVKYLKLRSGTFGNAEQAEQLSENLSKIAGSIENAHLCTPSAQVGQIVAYC